MKYLEGREACKNPIASFPFSFYSHPHFISFHLNSCNSNDFRNSPNLWHKQAFIYFTCETIFGIMLGVISIRPFVTPLLNCSLRGFAHLPLLPQSLWNRRLTCCCTALYSWREQRHVVLYCLLLQWQTALFSQRASGEGPCKLPQWRETCCNSPHIRALSFAFARVSYRGHDHPGSVHFVAVVCQNNPSPIQFSCTQCNEATKSMCVILEGFCELWEGWNEAWLCVYLSTSEGSLATVNDKKTFLHSSERHKIILGNCTCVLVESVEV